MWKCIMSYELQDLECDSVIGLSVIGLEAGSGKLEAA